MPDWLRPLSSIHRSIPSHLHRLLLAAFIGVAATISAWVLWSLGGHVITHADFAAFDLWASQPRSDAEVPVILVEDGPVPRSAPLPIPWDHAALARTISALTQADVAAIGVDEPITVPSSPDHGGATSDALLAEAIAQSERVVLPIPLLAHEPGYSVDRTAGLPEQGPSHPSWLSKETSHAMTPVDAEVLLPILSSVADSAAAVSHQIVQPDQDGHLRRVPLFVHNRDRLIPAFGLSLYLIANQLPSHRVRIEPGFRVDIAGRDSSESAAASLLVPIDHKTRALLPGLSPAESFVRTIPLHQVLTAVEQNQSDQIRSWADGTIVLLPSTTTGVDHTGSTPRLQSQIVLLHALYTHGWASQAAFAWSPIMTWFLAALSAWLLLQWPDWRGLAGAVVALSLYGVVVWTALVRAELVLPLLMPTAGLVVAGLASVLWNHLDASRRVRRLEHNVVRVQAELAAVREALVYQESIVEQLEEDLDAARTRHAPSHDRDEHSSNVSLEFQRELDEARTREDDTRRQLAALEEELANLRAVALVHPALPDAELESVRAEAERLGILTRDTRLLRTFRDLARGAQSALPILILGESGTGKELFARAVHQLSPRRSQPFVAVNMAAISPELFESELFGHVRGSFSGATQDRPGYFELAARGTIFLDEIGDLRPEHQAKLLRVLQDRSFYRVGATKPTVVDVRIVAATNKDLLKGIAEGWFREDLYARLKGIVVALPPLRDRPDDLLFLADSFLAQSAARMNRTAASFTPEALEALRGYHWPHNVRELAQSIEQAVALSDTPLLYARDLRLPDPVTTAEPAAGRRSGALVDISGDSAVLDCLRRHGFDMQRTARALGWDRSTVTQRLKGMCFQALVDSQGDVTIAATSLAQDPSLLRTVELKLVEYRDHLIAVIAGHRTESEAVAACRKRFKNLPDRHFKAVVALIHRHFLQVHQIPPHDPSTLLSPPSDQNSSRR
ncbi:hypothetical protein YTPLAS18_18120 [Nitrospira sp.]|nr:hypothetical protein YTPLAS18_18120 [Nitrospira sp.]